MDKIILKNMCFKACHGVLEKEKTEKQPFIIDLVLKLDLQVARETDSIEDTIDYASVYTLVKKCVMNNTFDLIEKLANEICTQLLNHFSRLQEIDITVKKPKAPLEGDFEYMGVQIVKKR